MKKSFPGVKPQFVDVTISKRNELHIKCREYDYMDSLFHFHDNNVYELVWIQESYGKRFVGNHIGDFEALDLVLVGPQLPHKWINDNAFYAEDSNLKARTMVLHFKGDLFMDYFDQTEATASLQKLAENARRGIRLLGKSHQKAIGLLEKLMPEKGLKKHITLLELIHVFSEADEYELLAGNTYKNSMMNFEYKRLNDVYDYVMKNFQQKLTVESVAKLCCMTTTAFCRYFKMHRNITFVDFLNEIRIGHACKLLRQTDLPVTDICFQSGYNNPANFNKFFKKITGTTPSLYKNDVMKL